MGPKNLPEQLQPLPQQVGSFILFFESLKMAEKNARRAEGRRKGQIAGLI